MKHYKYILSFLLLIISFGGAAWGANPLIYKINVKDQIGSNTWVYLKNGLHEAEMKGADCVLIHMNTYGGTVVDADSMRTAVLNSALPVYAFIDNNAASAGALIAIACDSIYMRGSASIGAATVVSRMDGAMEHDKFQSYMKGIMRATAESHGKRMRYVDGDTIEEWRRDPQIAERMVGNDSAKVLTLTANQALELGYCEGIAENVNQIAVEFLGFSEYDTYIYNPTLYDKIKGWLMNGVLQAFLIMIIIGGIYFELQSPGVGFPTAIALTAAILYFTPLYMTGYAQSWEILIFVLGLIFVVFEIFVIPGFGFVGISGLVLILLSLILTLIGNVQFDLSNISTKEVVRAGLIVSSGVGAGLVLIIYMSNKIGKPGMFRKIALESDQEGYVSVSMEPQGLVGRHGVAATGLRPSGKVMIDDRYYDAVSLKGFVEVDDRVIVRRYENFQLYVMKVDELDGL